MRLGRGVRGGVVMYGWGRKEMGMLRGDVLDSSLGLKVNLRASYLDWVARTSCPKVKDGYTPDVSHFPEHPGIYVAEK